MIKMIYCPTEDRKYIMKIHLRWKTLNIFLDFNQRFTNLKSKLTKKLNYMVGVKMKMANLESLLAASSVILEKLNSRKRF